MAIVANQSAPKPLAVLAKVAAFFQRLGLARFHCIYLSTYNNNNQLDSCSLREFLFEELGRKHVPAYGYRYNIQILYNYMERQIPGKS